MKKEKKTKKWYQVLLIILCSILVFAGVFYLGVRLYFRLPVSDYYKASEKGFVIPGISNGFIAQGISCEDEVFYVTGYMKGGSASPLYLVDKSTGKLIKTVYMAEENGNPYEGHCGGLSVHGDYIYIAGHNAINIYRKADVQKAADKSMLSFIGTFPVMGLSSEDKMGVAFITSTDTQLVLGEFYREQNYPTHPTHKLSTPSGDYNQALALAYDFSSGDEALFGLSVMPTEVLSITDQIQGMAVKDGKIYLSESYGVPNSHIYEYDKAVATKSTITYQGTELPMIYLDGGALTKTYVIAPMSEEIEFVDGRLYTMCESASNKYIFGKFTSARWCYYTKLEKMK